ncbi:Regulatory sensor-transducer, BlaR1/MecR1 family / TonB-dependent receptor [Mesoflavibacter sp. HG96]|uniref:M56 family metallopeptidase n=1 Tax=Mesoflavibacter TaxID=444051 RepID=UPI000D0FC799|nr:MULTISPECIES: M56 family metallopeptidase [Mesoflavibacter]QIJ88581.1 Regulatory sensor-transducer, BlaR1/MecR1 family / TonB-dependent receptor [Mesoflavibacter sp. HG96]QIJ91309.1 Regulatory sensor-transducer, BlaR1/MecR1 family / TonB-dependent receptor [Mesoflavibacter sp. HG37]
MVTFIIQIVAFQFIFLLVYEVLLKKETFFNYNRWYLLSTSVLSLLLPLIKIESFTKTIPSKYVVVLPEVVLGTVKKTPQITTEVTSVANQSSVLTLNNLIILGSGIAFAFFVFKLSKLLKLWSNAKQVKYNGYQILSLPNTTVAFSFFNYVFIGNQLTNQQKESVLAHELIHVKQKHSIDLLWFEVLKIALWFNPLVYIYKGYLTQVHEYIADQNAIKTVNKKDYYQRLLQQIFDVNSLPFINPFFKQSLIKKRIIMLQKSKSKPVYLFKYLLLIPMITAMLVYSSCSQDETNKVNTEQTTLTEEELVQKYLKEFENKYEHPLDAIVKEEVLKSENYLNTLDSYAKTKASFILMNNYFEEKNGKKPTYADNFENETYQDYLNRKQTQKAKDQWTNSPKRGALRLLVEDLDNLTNEEEAFKQSKLTQITNEEWYHTLVISDGYRHIKIEVREPNEEDVDIDKIDVPFSVIEQVPLIEGCESVYNLKEQKECFSNKINEHVMKNFNIALANNLGLEKGVKRIFVSFKIDVNGAVVDVNARAPHPELETEAIRVIKLLPKMVPGIHNGRVVNVPYSLPITFSIK